MNETPPNTSLTNKTWRWLQPPRGKWRWMLARLTVIALLLFLFRFYLLAWGVAGHNLLWRTWTRSEENHRGDVRLLLNLRGAGAAMLIRLGEAEMLDEAGDPAMIPALLKLARTHRDIEMRALALRSAAGFWDERVRAALVENLGHTERALRAAAIDGLRELGQERDVPALQAAVVLEQDAELAGALRAAISELTPRSLTETGRVKVAAIQFRSQFGAPAANRQRLEPLIREAARQGARMIVTPETAVTGYMTEDIRTAWALEGWPLTRGLRGISPASVAESVPGPSTTAGAALAKELGVYLTVPLLEVDAATGKYFNSVALVGPGGTMPLHYRKINPWPFAEDSWASTGDLGNPVLDTPYGRVALLICYDINFEPIRLRRLRVDTLLYPIAWVDKPRSAWFQTKLPAIARDHDLNIVGANWTVSQPQSWSGYGQSVIIERTGRVLARAQSDVGEEILYAEIPTPAKSAAPVLAADASHSP